MAYFSFNFLDHSKPILVFGCNGQVGRALQVSFRDLKMPVVFLGRDDCDLLDALSIKELLNRYQPQVIINAAAYTDVDNAETPGQRELAFAINAQAPALMARYLANVPSGILIHYSTDYVFADTKQTAYLESDPAGPVDELCVYGQSKLAGELAIKEAFGISLNGLDADGVHQQKNVSRYFILRTSWVYGDGGNFIRTILRLAGERDQLRVVANQIGVPTFAGWLAEVSIQMLGSRLESGIYHAVPDGEISWHGLAVFAVDIAASYGVDIKVELGNILPISAAEYPVQASRPYNSRLCNQKLKNALSEMIFTRQYPHWREHVEKYVKQIVKEPLKS